MAWKTCAVGTEVLNYLGEKVGVISAQTATETHLDIRGRHDSNPVILTGAQRDQDSVSIEWKHIAPGVYDSVHFKLLP